MIGTKAAGFVGQVLSGLLAGLLAAVSLTVIGFALQDDIARWLSRSFPSCDRTEGLVPVAITDVDGFEAQDSEGREGVYSPDQATDGYFGSLWAPPQVPAETDAHRADFADDPEKRTLILTLEGRQDVRLVCVNNGLARSPTDYTNWGKVRSIAVWTDQNEEPSPMTLPVFATDDFQGFTDAAVDLGEASTVFVRVDDAYVGVPTESFDPDVCQEDPDDIVRRPTPDGESVQLRFERGCLLAPTPRAGLSEIVLFTD